MTITLFSSFYMKMILDKYIAERVPDREREGLRRREGQRQTDRQTESKREGEKQIYFKEAANATVGVGESEISTAWALHGISGTAFKQNPFLGKPVFALTILK